MTENNNTLLGAPLSRWVKFGVWSLLWILVFVVWAGNLWMMLGVVVLFDIFITRYFSRYVGKYHRRAMTSSHTYKVAFDWTESIVFSVVVASLFHIFIFQMYVIPTSSMEKTLLIGDYLYVSKLTYGPKMPNTPLSIPLVHNTIPGSKNGAKSYSEAIKLPYKRLAGLKPIRRGDVVVFNVPAGDTVLLENPAAVYYREARKTDPEMLEQNFTVIARPVDKRENYVKRCVGLPGDTISLVSARLYVDGVAEGTIPGRQQTYAISVSSPFSQVALDGMGISKADLVHYPSSGAYLTPLTEANVEKVRAMPNVLGLERIEYSDGADIFPHTEDSGWTVNDYGPLWIPSKGATVALTPENLPIYERIIDIYENHDLRLDGDTIYIDGARATSYTFAMDYYWMMGDNRQGSLDSRYWGFVPEDHIVGKASFVWLSLDAEKGWFDGKIRWNKMFRKVR